jgi:segregation and condensation protein A
VSAGPELSLPLFQGPLDLLLELVRKNQVAIHDIPIAEITRQYLDYLHRADNLDLELDSDFAYMASVLIQIKSRCLLAQDPEIAARDGDPRQELVRLLLHHEQVRQGAEFLKQQLELSEAAWSKPSIADYLDPNPTDLPESKTSLNLLEVLRLAQQALNTARVYEIVTPADSVTVQQMTAWLEHRMTLSPGRLDAGPLFAEQPTAQRKAALFLAILELGKTARLRIEQHACFGPLYMDTVSPRRSIGTLLP